MIEYAQITKLPDEYIKAKIAEYLKEDSPDGDKTTEAIFSGRETVKAIIQAEEDLVFAGEDIIPSFFDNSFDIELNAKNGQQLKKGNIICTVTGRTDVILSRERVLLNIIQRLCGIATMARKYSDIAKPYNVKILDTRKTTPGLRLFEKFAVCVGSGFNHRLNLSSGILIKDNHIKAAGGIKEAIQKVRSKNTEKLKIEVEVENLYEIKEALEVGVDGFLLDNMKPQMVRDVVSYIRQHTVGERIFIEASGGINLSNLNKYVTTGIDAISSGAITHSVKSSEIHIEFI